MLKKINFRQVFLVADFKINIELEIAKPTDKINKINPNPTACSFAYFVKNKPVAKHVRDNKRKLSSFSSL